MSNINFEKGNIPTMEDIRKLSMNEPIIHTILMYQKHDGLTERDALISMVVAMTEAKNTCLKQAIKYANNSTQSPFKP